MIIIQFGWVGGSLKKTHTHLLRIHPQKKLPEENFVNILTWKITEKERFIVVIRIYYRTLQYFNYSN